MPPTKEEFRKQREEERDSNRKMQKTRERPKEREMPVMSGVDLEMDAMWAEREEETAQPVAKKQKFTGALSVTKQFKLKEVYSDVAELKTERNKLTGKLMRANLKGDKKKAAQIQV